MPGVGGGWALPDTADPSGVRSAGRLLGQPFLRSCWAVDYVVTGELFFASSNDLVCQFNCKDDPDDVVNDLSAAHIWDSTNPVSTCTRSWPDNTSH